MIGSIARTTGEPTSSNALRVFWLFFVYLAPLTGIGIVAPLLVWLLSRGKPFVREHAGRSFDLQVLVLGVGLVLLVVSFSLPSRSISDWQDYVLFAIGAAYLAETIALIVGGLLGNRFGRPWSPKILGP